MAQFDSQTQRFRLHDAPVTLSVLLLLLFALSWALALWGGTSLKPFHYTLFNFLLISIFALQKYRRFDMDASTRTYKLLSIGLLSGKQVQRGPLEAIGTAKVEPGIGGINGQGGRLILSIKDQPALILANTDLLPGSHRKLESVATALSNWLEKYR